MPLLHKTLAKTAQNTPFCRSTVCRKVVDLYQVGVLPSKFQDRRFQPLTHSSVDYSTLRKRPWSIENPRHQHRSIGKAPIAVACISGGAPSRGIIEWRGPLRRHGNRINGWMGPCAANCQCTG